MENKPMSDEKMVQLNVRVPQNLKKMMKEYVGLDAHKDLSELTRDALREKIQRDAPHLYRNLFREET
jgi:Arc/MetJ-type ribon-helix-helix transcriptional regulator